MRTRHLLFITARGVSFSSFCARTLRPFRFAFTSSYVIRIVGQTLFGIVPVTKKAMPRGWFRSFTAYMIGREFRAFATSVDVPPIVCRYVFVSRDNNGVGMARLVIVISATILPGGPAPYTAPRAMIVLHLVGEICSVPEGDNFRGQFRHFTSNGHAPENDAKWYGYQDGHSITVVLFKRQRHRYMRVTFASVTRAKATVTAICSYFTRRRPANIASARRAERDVSVAML